MTRPRGSPASPFTPIRLTKEAAMQPAFPRFVYFTDIGRRQMEDIHTDLMLVTMLSSQQVPTCLHARGPEIGDQIRQHIQTARFEGRRGQKLLVETSLPGATQEFPRRLLIAGIGSPLTFCAETAHTVFSTLIGEALKLGVKTVTIPFVANRGTGNCTNLKAMSYQLKVALTQCYAAFDGEPALEEIQILCSSQAKRFIQEGLAIPVENDAAESDDDDDCHCS